MTQPGMEELAVDPAVLERVAGTVEEIREDIDRADTAVGATAEELRRALAGWRLARATEEAALAWHDDARQLARWLDEHATALRRCAQEYRYQDEVTAEALALFPRVDPW